MILSGAALGKGGCLTSTQIALSPSKAPLIAFPIALWLDECNCSNSSLSDFPIVGGSHTNMPCVGFVSHHLYSS